MQERYISSGSSQTAHCSLGTIRREKSNHADFAWHDRIHQKVQSFCELPQSGRNPGDRE